MSLDIQSFLSIYSSPLRKKERERTRGERNGNKINNIYDYIVKITLKQLLFPCFTVSLIWEVNINKDFLDLTPKGQTKK